MAAQHRRRDGVIGRLDGMPVALKDNFDMAGWPTRAGLAGSREAGDGGCARGGAAARFRRGAWSARPIWTKVRWARSTDNPHFGADA